MALTWTDNEKELHKKREVHIIQQNVIEVDLDQKNLPTDVHLIEYEINGETYSDAVRAGKMTDIFDIYYDKLNGEGKVTSITSGYGTIKPKLWNVSPKKDKGG